MAELETDFAWGERYLDDIRRHLMPTAPLPVDRREATDLMVLELAAGGRVACRMRRPRALAEYPHDVTIRLSRPSGSKTELEKILEGFGDWYFYGFAHPSRDVVAAYRVLDLEAFRAAYRSGRVRYRDKRNGDGSSDFRAFDTRGFPPGVVVKRWLMPGARLARGKGITL